MKGKLLPSRTQIVHEVGAWQTHGVLLERYRFAPQLTVSLPPHSHQHYQFGLCLTDPGEYRYRGGYHPVPVGSLSVIHPGELHSVCGLGVRSAPTVFLSFYVPVALVKKVLGEAKDEYVRNAPFVPRPIIMDRDLELTFRRLHSTLIDPTRLPLEKETALTDALFALFRGHAEETPRLLKLAHKNRAVQLAREFLDAHYAESLSYDELARVTGMSGFHLSRSFHRAFGLPPHRYQLQCRIDRAKSLLISGVSLAEIAVDLGFSQQSHFGEQFRRLIGVPPSRYAAKTAGF